MKLGVDHQIKLMAAIIRSGTPIAGWKDALFVAIHSLDWIAIGEAQEYNHLHRNIPVIQGGPDEID